MSKKSKILVTGGTGYIGSHTIVELQNRGFDIFIIDNLSNSNLEILNRIKKITGIKPKFKKIDLCNYQKLNKFFQKNHDFDAVIHFAALKAVGESMQKPALYYQNNIASLVNLLGLMSKYNLSNLVFSSTASVYGDAEKFPVTEKTIIKKPANVYAGTKIIGEKIIQNISETKKDFSAIILRYFNVIGAHESGLIGDLPNGVPENLVPFITQTAIGKRKELKVFGNDYDTPDGTCIRDYIHVVDLAQAHISAVEKLIAQKNEKNYEIFNIGTGQGTSVMKIIDTFEKLSKQKLNYTITGRRPGDVSISYADVNLAKEKLNWQSQKSLKDSLNSAWKWEQKINK